MNASPPSREHTWRERVADLPVSIIVRSTGTWLDWEGGERPGQGAGIAHAC